MLGRFIDIYPQNYNHNITESENLHNYRKLVVVLQKTRDDYIFVWIAFPCVCNQGKNSMPV